MSLKINQIDVNSSQSTRYHYIDLIEFIAIFFVVLYHSTTYSYSWFDNNTVFSYIRYYLHGLLSTGVPLFLFANGYLLFNRSFNLKRHIVKIIKITVITILWGAITIVLLSCIKNKHLSITDFFTYLWTWKVGWIEYLWYMGYLVGIYIFFPLLKTTFDYNRKAFILFTIICAVLSFGNVLMSHVSTIALKIVGQSNNGVMNINWFNIFNPFRGLVHYSFGFVYFCVGGLAHSLIDRFHNISRRKVFIICAILLMLSCLGLFFTGVTLSNISTEVWDVVFEGYATIFTFVNVLTIFVLSLTYNGKITLIKTISISTLGIYFIHEILVHSTRDFFIQYSFFSTFWGASVYAFTILISSTFITILFRRIPVVSKLFIV